MSINTGTVRAVPVGVVAEDSSVSAVSWAAVFAGAFGAVAASIILIELGLGLGLSSTSAWSNQGASIAALGVAGGIWLIVVQWIASAIGGYLAGRLRTKWTGLHTDEVFFRDTAHGFLAWALATVIGVAVIALGTSSVLNAGGRAVGGAAQGAAIGGAAVAARSGPGPQAGGQGAIGDGYFVDMLYRPAPAANTNANAGGATAPTGTPATGTPGSTTTTDQGANAAPAGNGAPAATATTAGGNRNGDDRGEATRIFVRDLPNGDLTPDDRAYLAQSIAARTGISQADAQKRVDDTVAQVKAAETKARQDAEKARKAAASGSIIGALAMLIGAFIASVTGAIGGRLRDEYHGLRE
jgi:hypothetical protein